MSASRRPKKQCCFEYIKPPRQKSAREVYTPWLQRWQNFEILYTIIGGICELMPSLLKIATQDIIDVISDKDISLICQFRLHQLI